MQCTIIYKDIEIEHKGEFFFFVVDGKEYDAHTLEEAKADIDSLKERNYIEE